MGYNRTSGRSRRQGDDLSRNHWFQTAFQTAHSFTKHMFSFIYTI